MATGDASKSQKSVQKFTDGLRAMPIKVVYTLNDNIQQFFLARHTPIAVRVFHPPQPSRRQRQKAAKQLKSQQQGITPKKSSPTRRSQASAEAKQEASSPPDEGVILVDDVEESDEYGFAPLKVCLTAVWAARYEGFEMEHEPVLTRSVITDSPDLAYDRTREWSIYCLDPLEQSGVARGNDHSLSSKFSGMMTGMGLVSHALNEDDRTLTPVSVTGKIIEDQGGEALEVILQLKATMAPPVANPPYGGWPPHPMMYGYPPPPFGSFMKQPPLPPPFPGSSLTRPPGNRSKSVNPQSAPTPSSTDAPTPSVSGTTPAADASQDPTYQRASSTGPPKTNVPRTRREAAPPTKTAFTRAPVGPKGKERASSSSRDGTPALDVFTSLAIRLNSVDGGDEPPPPDTAEGQLLDCMVAWLKSASGSRYPGMPIPTGTLPPPPKPMDGRTSATAIAIPKSPSTSTSQPSSSQSTSQTGTSRASSQQAPSLSQSQTSESASTTIPPKASRIVLGNKGNASTTKFVANVSVPKTGSKGLSRSVSASHASKKRSLDDEDYGITKSKRLKTGRVHSGGAVNIVQSSASTTTAKPIAVPDPSDIRGPIQFPSSSDILGIKFAPKKAYTTNLDKPPSDEPIIAKKGAPDPETPRPKRRISNTSQEYHKFALTSPFVGGNVGDESLFSEAGTPAVARMFSPFKPLGRKSAGRDDVVLHVPEPSSPCERRGTIGSSKGKSRQSDRAATASGDQLARTSSPSVFRTPKPDWAIDLPPSSPPPPSSPNITESTSSTPADADDEEEERTISHIQQQPEPLTTNVEESPSKFFARYLGIGSNFEGGDFTAALFRSPARARATTPSEATSDGGYGGTFNFSDLQSVGSELDFDSSSSFTLDELGWTDGALLSGPGESSEGEFDDATTTGAASDLDFDVGDLLSWVQSSSTANGEDPTPKGNSVDPLLTQGQGGGTGDSDGANSSGQDPLRELLTGCVV
ncbi:hypothetical protein FRC17_006900 [Serendipita sp. 399]|nr:hypothetical protein FRC17_006900 [Serendipita sp. 399]